MALRRTLLVGATLLALLGGCASVVPRTVEVSHEQLQAALARRFPFDTRFLELFDIRLEQPRLQPLPESNRLRAEMTLRATDRLVRRSLQGALDLSFGLRYDAGDATVRLADVRVERLDLQGVPEALRTPAQRLGPFLAERILEDATLHRFRPEDLAKAQGWTPSELRVTATGVRITLAPPR